MGHGKEDFGSVEPGETRLAKGGLQFKLRRRVSPAHLHSALMSDEFQLYIPPSFMALFVPPGKIKPSIGQREMAARYELCEDMAQLLTEQATEQQFQLGITEDLALERCLQGLLATPEVVNEVEARWVVCRLAELLHWPLPEWAEAPPA